MQSFTRNFSRKTDTPGSPMSDNQGWWAGVCSTYEGYHHVFPRLGAALALLVPLTMAPLALNLIAIAVQALPANLLLSSRSSAWGSVRFRALLAAVYLALPNTREMLNNISQDQWPLTLCAFLLLVASRPKSVAARLFDLSILLLCGLTGPQCIFLFPLALFLAWKLRDRWLLFAAGVLAATCLVQAWGLLTGGFSSRPRFRSRRNSRNARAHPRRPRLCRNTAVRKQSGVGSRHGSFHLPALRGDWRNCLVRVLPGQVARADDALCCADLRAACRFPGFSHGLSACRGTMCQLLAVAGGIRYWYFPFTRFCMVAAVGISEPGRRFKMVSAVLGHPVLRDHSRLEDSAYEGSGFH